MKHLRNIYGSEVQSEIDRISIERTYIENILKRRSVEHLSETHRKSNIDREPIDNLSKIGGNEDPSKIDRRSMEHLWKVGREPIENL